MSWYMLLEFCFVCEEAGFRTLKEAQDFMKRNGIKDARELFTLLDKVLFRNIKRR